MPRRVAYFVTARVPERRGGGNCTQAAQRHLRRRRCCCGDTQALLSDVGAEFTALELDTLGAEGKAIRAELAEASGRARQGPRRQGGEAAAEAAVHGVHVRAQVWQ